MEDVMEYVGDSFACDCGQTHHIPLEKILIEKKALVRVPRILGELTAKKKIYIICDENTFQAAADELKEILLTNGYEPNIVLLETVGQDKKIHPNTDYLFKVLEGVDRDGYLIACGSGTINDLVRYAANKMDQPFMSVATAPSMDGYTSPASPITVSGIKDTYYAQPPEAVVADISVLKKAPVDMIRSGLGDLLGKISSQLDWRLSHLLFGEKYCSYISQMLLKELKFLLELDLKLQETDNNDNNIEDGKEDSKTGSDKAQKKAATEREQAIEALTRGLIKSGLAMLMAGTSRPASGTEHHVAHFLEMYSVLHNREITGHGINVGLGEFFASRYYLKLKDVDFSQLQISDSRRQREKDIKKHYQERSDFALNNLDIRFKETRLHEEMLRNKEEEIKQLICEYLPLLSAVEEKLLTSGIVSSQIRDRIPEGWLEKAVKYGFEIRTRFTVATLLKQVGYLDDWVEEIMQDFRALS